MLPNERLSLKIQTVAHYGLMFLISIVFLCCNEVGISENKT
jgi:hypothetical protein